MSTINSDTARALNEATIRACELANRLDDLGEPFPIIRDIPLGELAACIADMESAIGEIEEMEVQP